MKKMKILVDLQEFSQGSLKKKIITVLTNPCFHSVCLYRLSSFFNRIHIVILAKLMWYINRVMYCVDIDYRAKLAGGFVLKHGLGTVIGKDVETKGPVTIYQGVTIGGSGKSREYDGKMIDQPIIKENVVVYTDAKIFGPVIIGKNNYIKAGAVVSKDIEDRL